MNRALATGAADLGFKTACGWDFSRTLTQQGMGTQLLSELGKVKKALRKGSGIPSQLYNTSCLSKNYFPDSHWQKENLYTPYLSAVYEMASQRNSL